MSSVDRFILPINGEEIRREIKRRHEIHLEPERDVAGYVPKTSHFVNQVFYFKQFTNIFDNLKVCSKKTFLLGVRGSFLRKFPFPDICFTF